MSSRAKFVGCAHEKFANSFLPVPNSFSLLLLLTLLVPPGANRVSKLVLHSLNLRGSPENMVGSGLGADSEPSTLVMPHFV